MKIVNFKNCNFDNFCLFYEWEMREMHRHSCSLHTYIIFVTNVWSKLHFKRKLRIKESSKIIIMIHGVHKIH